MSMNENIERVLAELDGFRMCDQMDYDAYSRLHDSISGLDDLLKAQEPIEPVIEDERAPEMRFVAENISAVRRIIKVIDTHVLSFDDVAELVEVCAPFCDAAGSVRGFVTWLKNKEER